MKRSSLEKRKSEHLDLCATDDVAFESSTLLSCVRLVHRSLPELATTDVDTSVTILGKRLRAPIFIAAMTGGTTRAAEVNRELARIAEEHGYAFGLGSQRAMHKEADVAWTYQVRKVAPKTLLLGNVGIVQAREATTKQLAQLVAKVGADALCVHMNPSMELIQQDGDRDFRGGLATYERLVNELPVPVVAKETGCGVSLEVAQSLRRVGVKTIDVSGAGGTSWVGVETLRATEERRDLGKMFWNWGIPTAASVAWVAGTGATTIATGGIKNGLDVARAISLGASAAGIARPVLQAFMSHGRKGAERFLTGVENELRAAMLLTGSKTVRDLQRARKIVTGELLDWVPALRLGVAEGSARRRGS